MISLSDAALAVLTSGSQRHYLRVESWLGGQLLADDIPVEAGTEECDATLNVPERVTLTVPRTSDGVDWSPSEDDSPLAANGQRLRVMLGVDIGTDGIEWVQRGEFVIYESAASGDTVTVQAYGLLWLVSEAHLVSPYQPNGTLVSTLRGLIEPALTVVVDVGLLDRSVPSGINYDDDRLGAAWELMDAWPATALVQPEGYLLASPVVTPTTADLAITSTGSTATVVDKTGKSTRDGAANVIVARGTASDGGQVQGVAIDGTAGPHAYGGPFNPLPVPYYFASPLLTTVAQCNASAQHILDRRRRQTQRQFEVTMPPRPDVVLRDAVSVDGVLCTVEGLTLPYTAKGEMRLVLRTVT